MARQKPIRLLFMLFQLSLMLRFIRDFRPAADIWAMPLAIAWFASIPAGPLLQSREMYQLPVSRRTWWIARWWLAILAGVLLPLAGLLIAPWVGNYPILGAEELFLFTLFAFLYSGISMAIVGTPFGELGDQPIAVDGAAQTEASLKWTLIRGLVRFMPQAMAILFIPLALPFFFARFLPHTFAAIDAPAVLGIIVVAAVVARGYFHRPRLVARPSLRAPQVAPERVPVRSPESFETTRSSDWQTGVRLALFREGRKYLIGFTILFAFLTVGWAVSSLFRTVPAFPKFLSYVDALPFASSTARRTELFTWGMLMMAGAFPNAWMISGVRSLRALPLSTTSLSGAPVVLGVVAASVLWAVLLGLHLLVLQSAPVAPRPDLFLLFAGMMSITNTGRIILPGHIMFRGMLATLPVVAAVLGAEYFLDPWRPDILQPLMLAVGLALLATSFLLMRMCVTRSSRIYRPAPIIARFQ